MKAVLERIRDDISSKRLAVNPPLTWEELHKAEEALGYPLPELLRQMYITVGNGGFGPGNGILPLTGESYADTIVDLVTNDESSDQRGILEEYLPLFHWEGPNYGYFHVIEDDHVLIMDEDYLQDEFDRNRPLSDQYPVIACSLEQLLEDWLAGEPLTAASYRALTK